MNQTPLSVFLYQLLSGKNIVPYPMPKQIQKDGDFYVECEIMLKNVGWTYKTNDNRDVTALTNVTMNQDSKL